MRRRMLASIGGGAKLPTARDYPREGLVLQWDGIENDGFGVHNASNLNIVDLSGNGINAIDNMIKEVGNNYIVPNHPDIFLNVIKVPLTTATSIQMTIVQCLDFEVEDSNEIKDTDFIGFYSTAGYGNSSAMGILRRPNKTLVNWGSLYSVEFITSENAFKGTVGMWKTADGSGTQSPTHACVIDDRDAIIMTNENVSKHVTGNNIGCSGPNIAKFLIRERVHSLLVYDRLLTDVEFKKISRINNARFGLT